MFQLYVLLYFICMFHMFHMSVSHVNAPVQINDAYAHAIQVQLCKPNTWGVTGMLP
jgi:hypothetical protein